MRQDGSKEPHDSAEGQSEGCVSWSSGPPWEGARILQLRYHRCWIMDFRVWPRDKTPKSGVAHCKLSPSQESENEQMQNQIDAHLFFDSQGIVHKEFVPPGQTVNQTFFIGKSLKDSGKGWHVCDQALHAHGCCTTTTPHAARQSPSMNFCQKIAFIRFLSPLFAGSTSFYSPSSKTTWKGAILVLWIISSKRLTYEVKVIPAEAFQHC